MPGLYGGLRRSRVRRPISVARARSGMQSRFRSAFRNALRRKVTRKRGNFNRSIRSVIPFRRWPKNRVGQSIWSRLPSLRRQTQGFRNRLYKRKLRR